jgi:MFS transporter, ACS family, D-galactonate transporter
VTPSSTEARVPRLRWLIAALLSVGVLINYFDRIALSVAAPELQVKFGLSPAQLGVLFSAFFWSYALLQIPAGVWLDRFGVARLGRVSALCWGLASLMTAAASGFAGILVARITLGIAEAPSFPANSKATGHWFPRGERARATALFDAAAKFSNVVGVPLIALIIVRCGWRWGFAVVAALSFGYAWAFWRHYRDPRAHLQLTSAERDYIVRGGATPEDVFAASSAGMLRYLLRNRKIWGLSLGFAAYGYCFYFFLTWLPGYLVQTMHMSILRSSGLAAIPWACATVSDLLFGGWLIDHLIAKGHDATRVRKSVLLFGMTCGLAVVGATTTTSSSVAVFWISVALSGLAAAAPVWWSMPPLIAPKGGVGTMGGIMNLSNNMMGGVAPIVTGYIVGYTHSFADAFFVAGSVLLFGMVVFVLLVGPIEPLQSQ